MTDPDTIRENADAALERMRQELVRKDREAFEANVRIRTLEDAARPIAEMENVVFEIQDEHIDALRVALAAAETPEGGAPDLAEAEKSAVLSKRAEPPVRTGSQERAVLVESTRWPERAEECGEYRTS